MMDDDIRTASNAMNEAGYDARIHPYLVKALYNREGEEVFVAVVTKNGKPGLAIYTPRHEDKLKTVMF